MDRQRQQPRSAAAQTTRTRGKPHGALSTRADRAPPRAHPPIRHHAGRRLLTGERNAGELPKLTITRAWTRARTATFTPDVAAGPLAGTPYDLRHAAVSTWLSGGVPATTVAAWAGHSVEVLLKIYAKCLDGETSAVQRRIETALGHAPG